jgi:ribosomal protein S18 acetylase RimI-like enzyme
MNFAKIVLRPIGPEDDLFLRALFESVRGSMFDLLPLPADQKAQLIDMQYRAQRSQYEAAHPNAAHQIVEWQGHPVGVMRVSDEGGSLRLVDIALSREARGQGLGTHLIGELLSRGAPVHLQVEHSNPARSLYSRLGFVEVGEPSVYVEMVWNPA